MIPPFLDMQANHSPKYDSLRTWLHYFYANIGSYEYQKKCEERSVE